MEKHEFSSVILREYDIRGTVGKNLDEKDALALGCAFGTMVVRAGGKRIIVGFDGRTHSPLLEDALVNGLVSVGLNVVRIGLGPTPMLYFSVFHEDADAGVMVTGSHNPPDQNGFKMLMSKKLKDGGPVYGDAIKKLGQIAKTGDFESGTGSIKNIDVSLDYVDRLLKDFRAGKKLKVAWDNGNGAAGNILRELVKKLPGEHILLYPEVDGNFPNHHPDPTVAKNLIDLQEAVIKHGCDFGVAFDGDADRIGAVDGKGRILAGDQLLAVYATEVLKENSGATIIADVKASQTLFAFVASLGGKPLMWKTGHSLVKVKMAETNSPLAGEMSGHIFFADKWYGFDDAVYCAVRLMSLIGNSDQSLGEFRDSLPHTISTPEVRFDVEEAQKFDIVAKLKALLVAQNAVLDTIDGVRVNNEHGWWLIRASNTQAVLVARAESGTESGLKELKRQMSEKLRECGVKPPEF